VAVGAAEPSPDAEFRPTANELVSGNRRFAETFDNHLLEVRPTRHMAIVTCMDSRMDIFALLGLGNGEAHIIRNAGGVITDDVIRSLCLSQRYLGTREVVLVHHTDCGLQLVTEDGLKAELEAELGVKPWWAVESFEDPYVDVRQSMKRLEMTPFVPFKGHVRGFVYDVQTGLLEEVFVDDDAAAGEPSGTS
jgi:carbonic anhydrase